MVTSKTKAIIQSDICKVWKIVLEIENYSTWRSDLSRAEAVNEKKFIEYTKEGYPTTFTVTVVEPYKRWEFDMENSNMKGHWIGIFTSRGTETEIEFTEYVTAKKLFMKPICKSFFEKAAGTVYYGLKESALNAHIRLKNQKLEVTDHGAEDYAGV